jgi:transcriptional regulator with XRE-family HTH domain
MPRVHTLTPDGERIRAFRVRLGLDQMALSERIGRDRTTITKLETGGITKASELLIWQIARALGVQADDITREEVDEPKGSAA